MHILCNNICTVCDIYVKNYDVYEFLYSRVSDSTGGLVTQLDDNKIT